MANLHPIISSPRTRTKMLRGAVEAAGQSYVAGNTLKWSSGKVAEATPGDSIIGIAKKAAVGTVDTAAYVLEVEPADLVEFSTVDSGDSNNPVDASTFTAGEAYGMLNVSSVHCIDISDTDNADWIFVKPVVNLDGSTSYRGLFRAAVATSALNTPDTSDQGYKILKTNVTTTALNTAAVSLVTAVPGKQITIADAKIIARGGACTSNTSLIIKDTASSPVTLLTAGQSDLTENACVGMETMTCAASLSGTDEKGLTIENNGSDITVATSFDVVLIYTLS